MSLLITVSFQHEYFSEFVKEYVSPVNINIIMKGRVSPIKMNFNDEGHVLPIIMNFNEHALHMNIIT